MNQIRKHTFEAISLLTASNGMLDITIVPAANQPDWVIPSALILSIDDYVERIWTYLWQHQELAVFHLLPRAQTPDKLIVLEGNTPVHRLALQTAGELRHLKVRISDVKDTNLPDHYSQVSDLPTHTERDVPDSINQQPSSTAHLQEDVVSSYLFQTVLIDEVHYLVPDLEKIAHQLVDLDG